MYREESPIFDSAFSEASRAYLLETTRWTKFLAILMFIFIGIMMLGLLGMLASGTIMASMSQSFSSIGVFGAAFIILVVILLYTYPSVMLYRFSANIREGLTANNQDRIDTGFRCQRNMYRFAGILTIILLLLYLLIIATSIFADI